MSQAKPEVKCTCCNGAGHRKLNKKHQDTFHAAQKLTKANGGFTSFELAEAMGLEHSNTHHRIQRMVKLEAMQQIPKVSPARYRTV